MKRRSRRGGAVVVMRREGWPAFFTVVGLVRVGWPDVLKGLGGEAREKGSGGLYFYFFRKKNGEKPLIKMRKGEELVDGVDDGDVALLQGISWCIDSQLQPEFIFSDCLNLVTKVNGDWQDLSALSGLVSQIRLLFSNFPEASLKYLPRQFNANAHCLAKDAIKSREEAHKELF
uniref:RNase H type-1 domain-containing protein n=1 Tax=Cannabis sativa TaxID=3483 RepID=A0A803NH34_CANSA